MANGKKDAPQGVRKDVEPDEVAAAILSKISPSKVMEENPKKFAPKEKEPAVDLYTVYGVASGVKTGSTQYGAWEALTGLFEAVRVRDGRRFQSGICFLPGAAGVMALGALKATREKDPDASIRFGLLIGIKYSDVPIGYEYTARNVVKTEQADLLADLRVQALGYEGGKK